MRWMNGGSCHGMMATVFCMAVLVRACGVLFLFMGDGVRAGDIIKGSLLRGDKTTLVTVFSMRRAGSPPYDQTLSFPGSRSFLFFPVLMVTGAIDEPGPIRCTRALCSHRLWQHRLILISIGPPPCLTRTRTRIAAPPARPFIQQTGSRNSLSGRSFSR